MKSSNLRKSNLRNFDLRKLNTGFIFILFLFIAIINSQLSLAIGIAPGERVEVFNGQIISYDLRVVNDEQLDATYDITVNGELSKYITLNKNSISFSSQETENYLSLKLQIPQDAKIPPGEYTSRIIIRQHQSNDEGMVAFVGVVSKLIVTIPGDDAYIKANLLAPNFIKDTANSFSVDVVNRGTKEALNCLVVVDIFTSTNTKIGTVISNEFNILGTKSQKVLLSWTPNVPSGKYLSRASVVCQSSSDSVEKIFDVGSVQVNVAALSADDFELDSINKLNLMLESEWGEGIDNVYADVELLKDDVPVFVTKTESASFRPLEKRILPVYLDTRGLAPGKYSLNIMLHYSDKDVGEVFTLTISGNDIVIDRMSGLVVGGDKAKEDDGGGVNALLVIAIIIILVVNVFLVMKLVKNKRK